MLIYENISTRLERRELIEENSLKGTFFGYSLFWVVVEFWSLLGAGHEIGIVENHFGVINSAFGGATQNKPELQPCPQLNDYLNSNLLQITAVPFSDYV